MWRKSFLKLFSTPTQSRNFMDKCIPTSQIDPWKRKHASDQLNAEVYNFTDLKQNSFPLDFATEILKTMKFKVKIRLGCKSWRLTCV